MRGGRPHRDRAGVRAQERALPAAARRAVALTQAGLWWERLARGFWPAATLAGLGLAALALGLVAALPAALLPWAGGGWALLVVLALGAGWRGFRAPSPAEAAERVDRRLAGRPLAALGDRMALGGPAADGLWRAHLAQARRAAAAARMVPPDAGLARRDPYALRLAAMTALGMALLRLSPAEVTTPARELSTPAGPTMTCCPSTTSGLGKRLKSPSSIIA